MANLIIVVFLECQEENLKILFFHVGDILVKNSFVTFFNKYLKNLEASETYDL